MNFSGYDNLFSQRCVWVNGLVIGAGLKQQGVSFASLWQQKTYDRLKLHLPKQFCQLPILQSGARPSGLAVGACLKQQDVPFVLLEKSDCVASLWKMRTCDRLKLHLPKKFCLLPILPFPQELPEYPTKKQFVDYLESYANHFDIFPQFNECVQSAKYDEACQLWRVKTVSTGSCGRTEVEYICQWIVVATGENAECVKPEIAGLDGFKGEVLHVCEYKSGEKFAGKEVLVVSCGNSGMEVSLDLSNYNAKPSMVVRNSVHVLPREFFGKSMFEVATLIHEPVDRNRKFKSLEFRIPIL